jgi:chromosomal replication initiator protein
MIELWGEALRSLEPHVKPAHRNLWLRPIECVSIAEGHIHLRAPNRYHKEWFEDHFLPPILKDLESRTHQQFTVDFEIGDEGPVTRATPPPAGDVTFRGEPPVPTPHAVAPARTLGTSIPPLGARTPVRLPSGPAGSSMPTVGSNLFARYKFDSFVVGPPNRFAHSAALNVAESPGQKWNPLFIYGGVGVGKTHLLHAIGHQIGQHHPDWNVVFITCEQFVTEFIGSLMNRSGGSNQMEDFRARYRNVPDVLLIDDIQFLSNKDSSQDEFFHTFNALHYANKQIVLTCDKLPGEVNGLEDRLRSRFTWGLIAEMGAPDLETRVAILKRRAEIEGTFLPDDVALYMGTSVNTNVRDLEGALARVSARASFDRRGITLELAQDSLKGLLPAPGTGLTIEAIQRQVSTYFGVKLADLKGHKRHRAISHPRAIAMFLARTLTSSSYPEIGGRFGGKDHSTVISAVRKIEKLVESDPAQRSIVNTLKSHLDEG